MSFVGKAFKSVLSAVGLGPSSPPPLPALSAPTTAPTVANSTPDLDLAAQKQAGLMTNGRTSTMLTGGEGEDEKKLNTSKILLGQ